MSNTTTSNFKSGQNSNAAKGVVLYILLLTGNTLYIEILINDHSLEDLKRYK